jgi:hypothetical protein
MTTLTMEQAKELARKKFKTRAERIKLESKWGYRLAYINGVLSNERALPWWMLKELGLQKKKVVVYEVTA